MPKSVRVYIAGPLGFSETTNLFHQKVQKALADRHCDFFDPFGPNEEIPKAFALPHGPIRTQRLREVWTAIGQKNEEEITKSSCVIACLDGADVDSGTASEMGCAAVLNKRIFAWRNDMRLSGEEAMRVNLQVEYFCTRNGGKIYGSFEELLAAFDAWRNE